MQMRSGKTQKVERDTILSQITLGASLNKEFASGNVSM